MRACASCFAVCAVVVGVSITAAPRRLLAASVIAGADSTSPAALHGVVTDSLSQPVSGVEIFSAARHFNLRRTRSARSGFQDFRRVRRPSECEKSATVPANSLWRLSPGCLGIRRSYSPGSTTVSSRSSSRSRRSIAYCATSDSTSAPMAVRAGFSLPSFSPSAAERVPAISYAKGM